MNEWVDPATGTTVAVGSEWIKNGTNDWYVVERIDAPPTDRVMLRGIASPHNRHNAGHGTACSPIGELLLRYRPRG